MKTQKPFLLVALSLAGLFTGELVSPAASFTEAQFTRLENEVKVLKENAAPHAAAVGENVSAVSSVSTGANSRAELRFPDKSLTRLGANSRFTIRGDQRTLELDQGVMMLQVPKKMGGAKVRTAAVTAAVTGTTCITEYLPNGYIKLIVIEGEVELYSNKDHSHFQVVHPGQMIIMNPHATIIPPPVDVDLKRLLRTSRLLNQFENLPNTAYVNRAVEKQQDEIKNGDLLNTNLVIPGLGTVVSLTNNTAHDLGDGLGIQNVQPTLRLSPNPNNNGGESSTGNPGGIPAAFQGFLPLISGISVLNNTSRIILRDPTTRAFNTFSDAVLTSHGLIYRGEAINGPFAFFAFGRFEELPSLQAFFDASGDAAAFKFSSLLINGTPTFDIRGPHVTDVIIAANNDIVFAPSSRFGPEAGGPDGGIPGGAGGPVLASLDLSSTGLSSMAFVSQDGDIVIQSGFSIKGTDQNLALGTLEGDVKIFGSITLDGGIAVIDSGRNLQVQGKFTADDISVSVQRDAVIHGGTLNAENGSLTVNAVRNISVTDSAQLIQLSSMTGGGVLSLHSQRGNVTLSGSVNVNGSSVDIQAFSGNVTIITSDVTASKILAVRAQGSSGALTVTGGSLSAGRLIQLYATGNNGSVVFTDDATLASTTGLGLGVKPAAIYIAAKTVSIADGQVVTITQAGPVRIYTDNALFNIAGFGSFMRVTPSGLKPIKASAILPFASRPAYKGPRAFGPRPRPGFPRPFAPPLPPP